MTEERDHDLQSWFDRSVEELPHQPFALAVLTQVRRQERFLRLQWYAALLLAVMGSCLLLPELIAMFNMLAALPAKVIDASGAQWRLLVPITGLAGWLLYRTRSSAFLRGG